MIVVLFALYHKPVLRAVAVSAPAMKYMAAKSMVKCGGKVRKHAPSVGSVAASIASSSGTLAKRGRRFLKSNSSNEAPVRAADGAPSSDSAAVAAASAKLTVGRPAHCKCLACGSLSNNTKWLSYIEHVGRDTNSRKYATEDRCENHGRVYILYFSTLTSWEEFSESYRSKPQFKAIVNDLVASLPPSQGDATRERDDKSDSCTLVTETFNFLETKREVELVSEKTLCLRLKGKRSHPT